MLGAPEGRDQQISASEIAILGQIIRSCVQSKWNMLGGSEGAQSTVVKLRLRFNADGTLSGAPVIMNPQDSPDLPRHLRQRHPGVRGVPALPPAAAKYDVWKDIVLNFDPREMF